MPPEREFPSENRRTFLKIAGIAGIAGASGIPNLAADVAEAVGGTNDYKTHLNNQMDTHGEIVAAELDLTKDNISSNAFLCSVDTNDGFNTSCGGGGGGTTTTDDGGGGGGGGGGGSDPTPTPTPTPEPNDSPTARFTAGSKTVIEGQAVEFDASNSGDSDGSISSYHWDFDDGSTASGQTVTHTFSSAGTFDVTLTVQDDDGATNTANTTLTVGPGYEINYEFADGITSLHRTIAIGDDQLRVDAKGSRFDLSITQNDRDALQTLESDLQSYFGTIPSTSNPDIIEIGEPTTTTSIPVEDIDGGNTGIDVRFPDWVGKIPTDLMNKAFASWSIGGHAESAAGGDLIGAATAYGEAFTEVELSGSEPAEADIVFDGWFRMHTRAVFGSAHLRTVGFVRDVSDESGTHVEKEMESISDLRDSVSILSPFDPFTTTGADQFANAENGNGLSVPKLEPGHTYQIGVRVRSTATSFQVKPFPAFAKALGADLEGEHQHPAGDLWWGEDNIPDVIKNEGGIELSEMTIEWEEYNPN